MEKITKLLQKWRVRLGHLFGIAVLVFARPELKWLLVGTFVSLFGEAIRIISAGYIQKDQELSRTGPYAFTRNPLYVGSFFMYLGLCIAASNWIVLLVYIPFFFIIYYATIFREESYLKEAFKEDYAGFCADVPRFFPIPWKIKYSKGNGFSMALSMKNREYEALIAVCVFLGLMWAMGLTGRHLIH
ncbi:MAG TPA: isoprenylcysteine carboxylmethyltransferase family protein [bacterium]|nr:isoprenylcysteine carboxylmethyltransferase family protein [bacterium]